MVFVRRHDFKVRFLIDLVILDSLRVCCVSLSSIASGACCSRFAHGSPTVFSPCMLACMLAVVTYQSVDGIVVPASGRLLAWLDGVGDLVVVDTADAPVITTCTWSQW